MTNDTTRDIARLEADLKRETAELAAKIQEDSKELGGSMGSSAPPATCCSRGR